MSGLASAFRGMPSKKPAPTAQRPGLALQGAGKRVHPDFAQTGLYLRKQTKKRVQLLLLEKGEGDLSDLVEELLQEWMNKRVSR